MKLLPNVIVAILCFLLLFLKAFDIERGGISMEIESFDYSRYERSINRHRSDLQVKPITGPEDAISKADQLWHDKYGERADLHKPFSAFYNQEYDVWMIKGYTPPNFRLPDGSYQMGGNCYCFIIGDTGAVVAIWIDK